MSSSTRYERRLPELLDELAAPRTPAYFDDILGQVGRTRQRPGWTFLERWLPMSAISQRLSAAPRVPMRAVAVAALLLIALAIGLALLAGSRKSAVPAPFGLAGNGLIPYIAQGDLYLGDPVTGTTRVLVASPEDEALPQFSPDGTKVAFVRDVGTTAGPLGADVFVVEADGSRLRKITPAPVFWEWIAWTPDSGHVAVVHTVDGVNQLDMVDASGNGAAERLPAAAGLDSLQFRPPDGREILFRAAVDDLSSGVTIKPKIDGLFAMNADGTNVRTLVTPPTDQPADTLDLTNATYSADGSQIFYNHWTDDASYGQPGCCQLFVMNADGSDQHQFIPNSGDTWDGQAVVSPDGSRIAFWHNIPNRTTHGVFVVHADGTGLVETGPQLAGTAHWLWAPDASKILMFPNVDLVGTAYLLDPDGGPWSTIPWQSDADLDWQRLALPVTP